MDEQLEGGSADAAVHLFQENICACFYFLCVSIAEIIYVALPLGGNFCYWGRKRHDWKYRYIGVLLCPGATGSVGDLCLRLVAGLAACCIGGREHNEQGV